MTFDEWEKLRREAKEAYYAYLEAESARSVAVELCAKRYREWSVLQSRIEDYLCDITAGRVEYPAVRTLTAAGT